MEGNLYALLVFIGSGILLYTIVSFLEDDYKLIKLLISISIIVAGLYFLNVGILVIGSLLLLICILK